MIHLLNGSIIDDLRIYSIYFLMNEFNHSFISSTNWTEAVGLAASKAVLQKFRQFDPELKIIKLGNYWNQLINEVSKTHNFHLQTSGLPGLNYFNYPEDSDVFRTLFTIFGLSKNYLVAGRYYPNTAQNKEDLDQYAHILSDAITLYKKMNSAERLSYCGRVLPGGFNVLGARGV